MKGNRELLVKLLRIAAQLEHCLLNTYLYAACSLKSMPEEFEKIGIGGAENPRRAVQFERARSWKESLLAASKEEMVHIHYVQCLLRALGEPPCFDLPEREEGKGWLFPNWQTIIDSEGEATGEDDYVTVPIKTLDEDTIKEFILYESSDLLQLSDPFDDNSELKNIFGELADFEFDLHLAGVLNDVESETEYQDLKDKLEDVYGQTITVEIPAEADEVPQEAESEKYVRFESIGDLYLKGILPLYEQAFALGWVKYSNLNLNNELLDPDYAAEGFLPIGPFYRDKNFEQSAQANLKQPLRHYKNVEDVINEIVIEGEGFANFQSRAQALLDKVDELGNEDPADRPGERKYLDALIEDKDNRSNPDYSTPDWLADGQRLRLSHLYRFIIIWEELEQELRGGSLSGEAGGMSAGAKRQKRRFWQKWNPPKKQLGMEMESGFKPARTPIEIENNLGLDKITEELPAHFNGCYLVLLAWLSRMYEIRDWQADKPRRQAIQMLASWPLMSMAIRPLLELASFFPVNYDHLYRIEPKFLPSLPLNAIQLYEVYSQYTKKDNHKSLKAKCLEAAKEALKSIGNPALMTLPEEDQLNLYMDYLAVRVLSDAAQWASEMIEVFEITLEDEESVTQNYKTMILARLKELSDLSEFQKQFMFRVTGGYSNRLPDLTYQDLSPNKNQYEENPGYQADGLYQNTLAVRLRFSGYGLVQMATDPDPTADEVGCSGTHMLHADDYSNGTYRYFDHALIWQGNDDKDEIENKIIRDTGSSGPQLGINLAEVSLLVTDGAANAGFVPLREMNSLGAVQTTGFQQDLNVQGFLELSTVKAESFTNGNICLNLRTKGESSPFLNGLNHIVWKDGEPIDPFILAVYQEQVGDNIELFQREIFNTDPEENQEKTLLEMSPLQRAVSSRGPSGFDDYVNIPDWAQVNFSQEMKDQIGAPEYPMNFLENRANYLLEELASGDLSQGNLQDLNRDQTDKIISLAERTRLISIASILRGTTIGWLTALLHYGHTVSGKLGEVDDAENPIFSKFADDTQLQLGQNHSIEDRNQPNARWLTKYTKGVMDTDSLLDFVYFELYIPVKPGIDGDVSFNFTKAWTFPEEIQDAVKEYGCRFENPILADSYTDIESTTRTRNESVFGVEFTETKGTFDDSSYEYSSEISLDGGSSVTIQPGKFELTSIPNDLVQLKWTVNFTVSGDDESAKYNATVLAAQFFAKDAQDMTTAMENHFGPGNVNS